MLVDLHAHYPMHLLPPGRGTHEAIRTWPSERMRARIVDLISRLANYQGPHGEPGVTVPLLAAGGVGVVLSVLYSPFDEMDLAKRYGEPPDPSYFGRLLDQLELVNEDIGAHADEAQVVITGAALRDCLDSGRLAVIHAVEGGFHLGAHESAVNENIGTLAARGVAYVTLAHLFWRGVATNAPALPFLPDWLYRLIFPQPSDVGLTPLGEAAVRGLVEHGVLIDITHMSHQSLRDTFHLLDELDGARRIPVIASHIACRFGRRAYNLDDDAIRQAADRGGLLGVIDCRHYITERRGRDAHDRTLRDSIDRMCEHIDHVVDVTGGFEHVAIGTDLDGFIKPALTGLEHAGRLGDLEAALIDRYGPDNARKICSDNALRVLHARFPD